MHQILPIFVFGWLKNIHVLGKEKEGTSCLYKVPILGQALCLVLLCTFSELGGIAPVIDEDTVSERSISIIRKAM